MTVCADTSFLFSLYGKDTFTARARRLTDSLQGPVSLSVFTLFELENAVRFAVWRRLIAPAQGAAMLEDVHSDLRTGYLLLPTCDHVEVVRRARGISARFTLKGGHRAYDILNVAAALTLGAGRFLTFDENQKTLAQRVGLGSGRSCGADPM